MWRSMSSSGMELGRAVSVSGSGVTGLLVPATGATTAATALQIGAVVRIPTPGSIVYGMIASMRVDDPSAQRSDGEKRFIEIELLGEELLATDDHPGRSFQRGVSVYPALGSQIEAASREDLSKVYARPMSANVRVGVLHQDRSLGAFVATDELLGKHFAVLGTSGSGKSCTVALVLRAILDQHPAGHIVLLDPHNEYARAFGERAELVDTRSLQLPYWLLDFQETVEVLVGRDSTSQDAERAILKNALMEAKRKYLGDNPEAAFLTVDTPVPYRMQSVLQYIDNSMGRLDKPETSAPYLRLKQRIEALSADSRFSFMFSGMFVSDEMPAILGRLLRLPVDGKPITIVDLSGVPSEIVEVVVSMLCRTIFSFNLWSARERTVPVLLVCEEAHRYVPRDEADTFPSTRQAIARIAKEGRKYGVSLCLISQRPSELSASVLSQCNTLFALRMSNQTDQDFVAKALPDGARGLLAALPALKTQEAIAVGEAVSVPMRLTLNDLVESARPQSGTASFSKGWQESAAAADHVPVTVTRWRRQQRYTGD
jgi:DNA helicase HerA-like ATPase